MYSYLEVQITITPKQNASGLKRGIAIQGLFWTVYGMITADHFLNVNSTLMWEGKEVGYPNISTWLPRSRLDGVLDVGPSNTTDSINSTGSLTSIRQETTSGNALTDEPWTMDVFFFGSTIPIHDMFITILGVLSMLAVPPSDEVATLWSYHVHMLNTAYLSEPKRPNSFLKWENLIKALADLPRHMVREQKFTEVRMEFIYQDRDVGSATLSRRVGSGGLPQLPSNISTS